MPLDELFDEHGPVSARRTGALAEEGVQDRLRSGAVRFVVARIGEPLTWLRPGDEVFAFWKSEVRPRLWAPSVERAYLEEFADERAWAASEWRASDGSQVVLFEEHH